MKTKLTRQQLKALLAVFDGLFRDEQEPHIGNFEARLLLAIMQGIHLQLKKKVLDVKTKYNLKLTDVEALAFWIFFNKFDIRPAGAIYEANLIDQICNLIHQSQTK